MIFYVFHTNFSLHDSLENAVFLAFGMTEISPPQRGSYIVPKHPAVLCTAYSSVRGSYIVPKHPAVLCTAYSSAKVRFS